MDVVITYVDGNDPVWRADYERATNIPLLQKRFRDWGTLKYLLRGIEKYMPFINNVFLVVAYPSQVPEWVDTANLKIVLHKDIIPSEYLPTFNCNPIEMHLHRIPGLGEEFLYFNDDMFPVRKCSPEDFFRGGKGVIGYYKHFIYSGMYKKICRNSDKLARSTAGKENSLFFIRPQHTCVPLLKSVCEELYSKIEPQILLTTANKTRTGNDLNQYLFWDYMYFTGKVEDGKISNKHFSAATATVASLRKFILNPTRKMVCINDVHLSESKFEALQKAVIEAFEIRLPDKSRFELQDR